jgi:hypothetical protein
LLFSQVAAALAFLLPDFHLRMIPAGIDDVQGMAIGQ